MPDPIKPMSETKILSEFTSKNGPAVVVGMTTYASLESSREWLRSALRSYLAWAANEAMPEKKSKPECMICWEEEGCEDCGYKNHYNKAIDEYRANLMKLTE